jgi:hypothetical protein
MTLLDKQLRFSDAQDISQVAGTYASTNVLDLSKASPRQIGSGAVLKVGFNMVVALVGATATLNVRFVASAATDLSTPTVLRETGALAVGTWVAGYRGTSPWMIPIEGIVLRYLGFDYIIATATTTAGTIDAYLAETFDSKVNGAWTGIAAVTGHGGGVA